MNIEFEWDENKNEANLYKHGVDFEYAMSIFLDDFRIEYEDNRKNYGELRLKTIGMIGSQVYTVIYTKRHHKYRIISARRAHHEERKNYYFYLETRR